MQVAFLKSGVTFLGWIVKILGQGEFAHAEIVFSDGECVSCVADEGLGYNRYGVRMKRIQFDKNWVLVDLKVAPEQEAIMRAYAEGMVGLPYDVLSLVFFTQSQWPTLWRVPIIGAALPGQYICSEALGRILKKGKVLAGSADTFVSPAQLYKLVA